MERLTPDDVAPADWVGRRELEAHVVRYEFASKYLRPGRVLDIACGTGYGTRILAERGEPHVHAVGVDSSPGAITHARRRYPHERARYVLGDAMSYEDEPFDTIVCLETIEHVDDPSRLVDRLHRLLLRGGTLVASVPVTPSVDINPYHLHDLSERQFRRLFEQRGLRARGELLQTQPYAPLRYAREWRLRSSQLRPSLPLFYARHPALLLRRAAATLRYGAVHRHLTVAWVKPHA